MLDCLGRYAIDSPRLEARSSNLSNCPGSLKTERCFGPSIAKYFGQENLLNSHDGGVRCRSYLGLNEVTTKIVPGVEDNMVDPVRNSLGCPIVLKCCSRCISGKHCRGKLSKKQRPDSG